MARLAQEMLATSHIAISIAQTDQLEKDKNDDRKMQHLQHGPTTTVSLKTQQLRHNDQTRAYYQYFHDAHPLLLPFQALQGPLGTQHVPPKVITVIQYIGSHFLPTSSPPADSRNHRRRISEPQAGNSSPSRDDAARYDLETEAFSCLSLPEEDGYQVQCMLLLSITAHAHGNFVDAIRLIKSAVNLALKLGMNRHLFSVAHGHGSVLLEEMWRRCYWELFVVESLLCALIEESAELYRAVSDVPFPCDEGMSDSSICAPPSHTIQDLLNHCQNRAQLVDLLPSFAYRIAASHFLGSVLTSDARTTADNLERFHHSLIEHVDHKSAYSGHRILSQPDHIAQLLSQTKVITCSAMIYFYRQRSKLIPIRLQRNILYSSSSSSSLSSSSRPNISIPVFPSSFILHSKHPLSTTTSINKNNNNNNNINSKKTTILTSDPSSQHLISTAKHLATQLNNPRLVRSTSPLIIDAIALAMLVELAALLNLNIPPSSTPLETATTTGTSTSTRTGTPTPTTPQRERLENEFANSLGVLKKFAVRWPLAKTVRDLLVDEYENLFRPERAR